MTALLHPILRRASWWTVRHIKDEVIEINGGRLNVDLLHRVLRAKRVQEHRTATAVGVSGGLLSTRVKIR